MTVLYTVISPTVVKLSGITKPSQWKLINKTISYKNAEVDAEIMRLKKNRHWKKTNLNTWSARLEELNKHSIVYLYNKIDDTTALIRNGSVHYLRSAGEELYGDIINNIKYPQLTQMTLDKPLNMALRAYQKDSVSKLIERKHAHIELSTGTGKSLIILSLVQQTYVKTAIIVPGIENFEAIVRLLEYYCGKNVIGHFGNSRKNIHASTRVIVCIGKSLSNLKIGTPEYDFFKGMEMIIFDESHTSAVKSLDHVCNEVFADVPYRFFMSATQVRSNNETPLLQSIIGECVYDLTISQAVEYGFISPHDFEIYNDVKVPSGLISDNPLIIRRDAFLNNPYIAKIIAKRAMDDLKIGKSSLILIDEVNQINIFVDVFKEMYPQISFNNIDDTPVVFAHSETKKDRLREIGLPTFSTGSKLINWCIEKFNKGEKQILVGTSCIHTGCNLYPQATVYNWYGTASEIKTKQGAIGRAIRKYEDNPYKNEIPDHIFRKSNTTIVDFDVGVLLLRKHLKSRIEYYKESRSIIRYISKTLL